jgi:hypothetical protein
MSRKPFHLDDAEKNSHPFNIPEDYFDKLSYRIQDRIPARPEKKSLISMDWRRRLVIAGSMMTVVLALIWVTLPERYQGNLGAEPLAMVSDDAIIDYLSVEDLSFENLSENKLVQSSFEADIAGDYFDGFDEEAIREELLNSSSLDINI